MVLVILAMQVCDQKQGIDILKLRLKLSCGTRQMPARVAFQAFLIRLRRKSWVHIMD